MLILPILQMRKLSLSEEAYCLKSYSQEMEKQSKGQGFPTLWSSPLSIRPHYLCLSSAQTHLWDALYAQSLQIGVFLLCSFRIYKLNL